MSTPACTKRATSTNNKPPALLWQKFMDMKAAAIRRPTFVHVLATAIVAVAALAVGGLGHHAAVSSGVEARVAPTILGSASKQITGDVAQGGYAIVASGPTDRTEPSKLGAQSIDASAILSADRATTWNPGVRGAGGIPTRTTVCSTLEPRGGTSDDTAQIQAAINACPAGQVVQLAAGTFLVNSGNYLLINKGITLRGAGPGETTLAKTDGAKPFKADVSAKPSPLIIVGPHFFSSYPDPSDIAASTSVTADAVKGEYSVTVASATGFSPGQIVLLDEASGGRLADPTRRVAERSGPPPTGASSGRSTIPPFQYVDDFARRCVPDDAQHRRLLVLAADRPTAEVKQIASVSGSTITFTTPIHISYRASQAAQLSRYRRPHVMNAGVEDLKLVGGDAGNLRFQWAALSWARNVDNTHGTARALPSTDPSASSCENSTCTMPLGPR